MAQTKNEIQALLAGLGTQPRHRFGQNFMIDQNLLRLVADAGQIRPGELVVEVGPGTGTLTEELLSRGAEVLAVEIDRDLAGMLRKRLAGEGRFRLIEGDALESKHRLNAELMSVIAEARGRGQVVKLVANLPYNIASPLIIELLIAGVELLAFTVQKEVADRLRAAAGSEAYGMLTVMAQLLSEVKVLRTLPPQAFWPAPTIDSALVQMMRRPAVMADPAGLGQFLQKLFSARRKTLRKGLAQAGYAAEEVVATAGIDGRRRPEELGVGEWVRLYEAAGDFGF